METSASTSSTQHCQVASPATVLIGHHSEKVLSSAGRADLYIIFSFEAALHNFYFLSKELSAIAPALNLLVNERETGWYAAHRSTCDSEDLVINCDDVHETLTSVAPFLGMFDLFFICSECGGPTAHVVGKDEDGNPVDYDLDLSMFLQPAGDFRQAQ